MQKLKTKKQIQEEQHYLDLAEYYGKAYNFFKTIVPVKTDYKDEYTENDIPEADFKQYQLDNPTDLQEVSRQHIAGIFNHLVQENIVNGTLREMLGLLSEYKLKKIYNSKEELDEIQNNNVMLRHRMINVLAEKGITFESVTMSIIPQVSELFNLILTDLNSNIDQRKDAFHFGLEMEKYGRAATFQDANDFFLAREKKEIEQRQSVGLNREQKRIVKSQKKK